MIRGLHAGSQYDVAVVRVEREGLAEKVVGRARLETGKVETHEEEEMVEESEDRAAGAEACLHPRCLLCGCHSLAGGYVHSPPYTAPLSFLCHLAHAPVLVSPCFDQLSLSQRPLPPPGRGGAQRGTHGALAVGDTHWKNPGNFPASGGRRAVRGEN